MDPYPHYAPRNCGGSLSVAYPVASWYSDYVWRRLDAAGWDVLEISSTAEELFRPLANHLVRLRRTPEVRRRVHPAMRAIVHPQMIRRLATTLDYIVVVARRPT